MVDRTFFFINVMARTIILAFVSLLGEFCFPHILCAQQKVDESQLRVHYIEHYRMVEESKGMREEEKILDIGKHLSLFQSLWAYSRDAVMDSVLARGGSFGDIVAAQEGTGYPRSYSRYIIFKNYPQENALTCVDRVSMKNYVYTEALEKPDWNIVPNSFRTIVGYRCQAAETNFRGRVWKAWFAADIPVSDGPWKLFGLPGLILKAEDETGEFSFTCIRIERQESHPILYNPKKAIKCTREEMTRLQIKNYKDPDGLFRQQGYEPMPGWDANGKPLVYKPRTLILMERDLAKDDAGK
jgi:GLPGLI family protein